MFYAFLLVCAVDISGNEGPCLTLNDEWGPYKSVEHCEIRTKQMLDEIFEDPLLNIFVGEKLDFSPTIIYDFICIDDSKVDV